MGIYKFNVCDSCQQYIEDCGCCSVCGTPEGHTDKVCPEKPSEKSEPPPKHSCIKTLVGVGKTNVQS